MRYWDSSALIPLLLEEPGSARMMAVFEDDPFALISAYATIEIASALWRRRHDGEMTFEAHQAADRVLADLAQTWVELEVSQAVIDTAVSVLSRHRLRSGDALQLGRRLIRHMRISPLSPLTKTSPPPHVPKVSPSSPD